MENAPKQLSPAIPEPFGWDLSAIVEASDDAIICTDLDGCVLSWNRGAERMYGYPAVEMIGGSVRRIVPAEEIADFEARLLRLRDGEKVTNFNAERIGKTGTRLSVSVNIFPLRDAGGKVVAIASVARNVSAIKAAAETLRRSEERYRAIVEDQTEMICRSLPDSTLTFVNESYARYFGKTAEEMLGVRYFSLMPLEDAAAMAKHLSGFSPAEPVSTSEHQVIRPDGSLGWHQWTDRAIYDDESNLLEFQSVGRDITERKKAERALLESEELNRAVLGSLRDQIAVLDAAGNIIAVNEGWNRYALSYGLASAASVGVGINYLDVCRRAVSVALQGADRSLEGIRSVLDGRSETYREEYLCSHAEGDKWFVLSVTPLRRPEGGAVISHIDVTERKLAEAALVESGEKLRSSRDEVRSLAGRLIQLQEDERRRVAAELHDGIGQSLAIIRNRVEICLNLSSEGSSLRDQLVEIDETARGAIDEVREIAHGLRPFELDRLGLKNAVESMAEKIEGSSAIKVETRIAIDDGLLSETEETGIYRIVQEALSNVIRHSRAEKVIISIGPRDGAFEVMVADDGVGIGGHPASAGRGFGLSGIAERARMINAEFTVENAGGTVVSIRKAMKNGG